MTKKEKETYKITLELFNNCCAICGKNNPAMHHIRFGAVGRKTYMGNVIPLCPYHHRMVHSNKRYYQPILIDMINERMSEYEKK